MIIDFKDSITEDIFDGVHSKKALKFPRTIWSVAQRKLDMLNAAKELKDLRVPPGNRLEALKGVLKELHSIRINDQFRILFRWEDGNVKEVQIIDITREVKI